MSIGVQKTKAWLIDPETETPLIQTLALNEPQAGYRMHPSTTDTNTPNRGSENYRAKFQLTVGDWRQLSKEMM